MMAMTLNMLRVSLMVVFSLALITDGQLLFKGLGNMFPGVLLPHDPKVREGGTLVLTCSMDENYKNRTSADMAFALSFNTSRFTSNGAQPRPLRWLVDEEYTTPLNKSAIQLRLEDVRRDFHQDNVECGVQVNQTWKQLAWQIVIVIFDPKEGELQGCMVYKKTMNCTWEPTHVNQSKTMNHRVTDTLIWRLSGERVWKQCLHPYEGYCIWEPSEFTEDAVYEIRLNISTKYSHTLSNITLIKSRDIVKLPQISEINIKSLTKRSVDLEWPPPTTRRSDILYAITYKLTKPIEGGDETEQEVEVENLTRVPLEGLVPFVEYRVKIRSITETGGYMSQPAEITFKTLIDVPLRNPDIALGSYSIKNLDIGNCREITFFWNPILDIEKHGPGFKYIVTERRAGYTMAQSNVVNIDNSPCNNRQQSEDRVKITVPQDSAITIYVTSQNDMGNSRDPALHVTVPANNHVIPGPTNFTAIAESETKVILRWDNLLENDTTGYHVYWCHKSKDECEESLQWKNLSADSNYSEIELPEGNDGLYLFGISREAGDTSSGILWSDCTYDLTKLSPPPKWLSEAVNGDHGELLLSWDIPFCHIHRGYIYSYQLSYCPTEGGACPNDTDATKDIVVPNNVTSYTLVGLDAFTTYCVTIRSLTAKGPSPNPSEPKCGTVTGTWLSSGVVAGFIIGGIFLMTVLVFCLFRFGKNCMRVYHKFQTGVKVEMPHTSYTAQNSVSSQKGLVEDDENYYLTDYSGLAKQHSQESTADSGRGSLSQDHIRTNLHRVSSGDLDEVFPIPNGGVGNGFHPGGSPISEPVTSYARIAHASGGSSASQPTNNKSSSLPRPKLPARNLSPHTSPNPGASSGRPDGYNSQHDSPGNNSMPSYVMVGDDSKGYGGHTHDRPDNQTHTDVSLSPLSDYVKAQNKSGDYDSPNVKTSGNVKHNTGYITVPENVKPNTGYITLPENVKQDTGNVPALGDVKQDSCYVPVPEPVNPHSGYITRSELGRPSAQPQIDPGYILAPPPPAEQAKPNNTQSGQVAGPGGYITLPAGGTPSNTGYIPAPVIRPPDPGGYISAPDISQAPPRADQQPSHIGQSAPISAMPQNAGTNPGYIQLPNVGGGISETQPRAEGTRNATGQSGDPPRAGTPNQNGYVTMPTSVPPASAKTWTGAGEVEDPGYVQGPGGGITPPLGASTPQPYTANGPGSNPYIPHPTANQGNQPVTFNPNRKAPVEVKPQTMSSKPDQTGYVTLPVTSSLPEQQPYISIPDATVDSSPYKPISGVTNSENDANHNNVTPYIDPSRLDGHSADADTETSSFVTESENAIDGQGGEEETHLLLPSNGGRKVLNKSGYVVVSP